MPDSNWPESLTPELSEILGRPNFMCMSIANVYRAAGFDIPNKSEVEQAFVLHRFIGIWMQHGVAWKDEAEKDIREHHAKATKKVEADRALISLNQMGNEK